MKVTFCTNFIHHHQIPLADEFFKILGEDYRYVATEPLPEWLQKGGYDSNINRSYIVRSYESESAMQKARALIENSDVVIAGAAPMEWFFNRQKNNKLTFHCSERILKTKFRRIFFFLGYPLAWKWFLRFRNKRSYVLCASAFLASDLKKYHAFLGKCFKWGYFTKVDNNICLETIEKSRPKDGLIHLMWCARFLKLKHPELVIQMASSLKTKGYRFVLDMYGTGEELENTKKLIAKLDVQDCVFLKGNMPNEQILEKMRENEIFLFTSDSNEGWGAVVNEAMSNGCVVVGSDKIGSIPYLVKDKDNGCVFKSENIHSLTRAVQWLFDNPQERLRLSANGIKTMQEVWSPQNAASSFLQLLDDINNGRQSSIKDGPCSVA